MFSPEVLQKSMAETVLVVNFQGGFDTFTFRKAFESSFNLSKEDQCEILDYLKTKIHKEVIPKHKQRGCRQAHRLVYREYKIELE